MRALCFGSLNRDHTYRLHHFLRPGETNHALSYDVLAGGKGLNQALSLARAGAETFMGGCIGEDGLSLQTFLQNNGVDTQYLKKVEAPTGHAIIQVEDSGENCILVYPGANYALTEEQIEETLGQFAAGDLLLVQNETNLVGMLLQKAKEHGMITALNPSPISETLREEIPLAMVDWLILNRAELSALAGAEDLQEAVKHMQEAYPRCRLVVTLGAEGAVYCDGNGTIRQPAYAVQTVDTTGAGDTFTGYFLETYYRTLDPKEALRRAAAAAALAVTRPGAAASIPAAEEVSSFLKK